MTGNPKTSKYYSLKRSERASPSINLTLSQEAADALALLATGTSKSKLVSRLILAELERLDASNP